MLLGPVSYLDCFVFCLFLAPQLVWQVGFFETTYCVLQALPFFCKFDSGGSFLVMARHVLPCSVRIWMDVLYGGRRKGKNNNRLFIWVGF